MTTIKFSEDHIDALRELMNIAAGEVTAILAQLLNTEGTMHIPKITLCSLAELNGIIAENIDSNVTQYTSKQLFYGKMSGESLFVFDKNSAITFKNEVYNIDSPGEEDILDSIGELANIIGVTMLSRLANELETLISFSAPLIQSMASIDICKKDENSQYTQVIIMSTRLEFTHSSINGFFYILAQDDMIKNLKALIDIKLEEVGL